MLISSITLFNAVIATLSLILNLIFSCINKKISDANLKIQESQNKQQKERLLTNQANKVATWIVGDEPLTDGQVHSFMPFTTYISNESNLPIFNLFVIAMPNNGMGTFKEISTVFSSEGSTQTQNYVWRQLAVPGKTAIILPTDGSSMGGVKPVATILFTDASGKGWYRNINGVLSEHDNYFHELRKWGLSDPGYKASGLTGFTRQDQF